MNYNRFDYQILRGSNSLYMFVLVWYLAYISIYIVGYACLKVLLKHLRPLEILAVLTLLIALPLIMWCGLGLITDAFLKSNPLL